MTEESLRKWKEVSLVNGARLSSLLDIPHLDNKYIACAAILSDGTESQCVIFVEKDFAREELPAFGPKGLGVFYRFCADTMIDAREVAAIRSSPLKLPLAIERKMREHGQTHMAGYLAKVVLNNGRTYWHAWGEQPWFVTLLEGCRVEDIVDVVFPSPAELQGVWKRERIIDAPVFKWCVYRKPV
jgi:hypothetical protein